MIPLRQPKPPSGRPDADDAAMVDFGEVGRLRFASEDRPWQRSLRWTKPPRNRRRLAVGVLIALFLTAIEIAVFDVGMRRQIDRAPRALPQRIVQVELIETIEPAVDDVPEPLPPPREHTRPIVRGVARPSPQAPSATVPPKTDAPPPSAIAPTLDLFDAQGQLRLPQATSGRIVDESAFPSGPRNAPQGDPFARRNPLPYQPTPLERYFPDSHETLGGELVRKTTFRHTWRTPWGSQITCSTSLVLGFLGGCGWGPAPTATIEELKSMRADPPPAPASLAPVLPEAPAAPASDDPTIPPKGNP